MILRTTTRLFALVAIVLIPVSVRGQEVPPSPVRWTATAVPAEVAPGGLARLRLTAEIEDGWHLYALDTPAGRPLSVRLDGLPDGVAQEGSPTQATPKEGFDPNFQSTVRYFDGTARVDVPVRVGTGLAPGAAVEVKGGVTFMVCNDRMCLPPRTEPFAATFTVTAGAPSPSPQPPSSPAAAATPPPVPADLATADTARALPIDVATQPDTAGAAAALPQRTPGDTAAAASPARPLQADKGGLLAFLLLAVGAGLGALLMPCVFPMIPLTVSYFTRHAGSRHDAVRMALVFGGAVVVLFTGLGLVMALVLGAAGAQTVAANPFVNLLIGGALIAFGLSLIGLFELRLPARLVNAADRQSRTRAGLAGVVFMALTLTLVSFACTAPFVGGLLAATAGGQWTRPLIGMAVFSATFAAPFVGLALFPRALSALPRSGAWMDTLKVTLGLVELAAALKFLSNADLVWGTGLLSRPLVVAAWVVIAAVAGLYVLGKLRLRHEAPVEGLGGGRLVAGGAFLVLALYLVPGLLGGPLGAFEAWLPPRQATDAGLLGAGAGGMANASAEGAWLEDRDSAFALARTTGRPVFVDFTGYTCTNCRAMEANVFPHPEVAPRLANDFVRLRLWTDDAETGPALQRYQLALTGTVALPTYALVSPDGRLLAQHSGMASPAEFAAFLGAGASRRLAAR